MTNAERERMYQFIAAPLEAIEAGLEDFGAATVIVRKPGNAKRYIVVTNEPDDIVGRLKAAIGADEDGETTGPPSRAAPDHA